MQKKMCARKKKEKSIPATPIAKGDELPPGIIRDDGPGNPPLPLLLPTSKSGMVGENSPKSVTGGDGDGAGRRKNGESIGGPVPPPPPPPLRTGEAASHAASGAPRSGRGLQRKGPNPGAPIGGGGRWMDGFARNRRRNFWCVLGCGFSFFLCFTLGVGEDEERKKKQEKEEDLD
jgi:hypothetical protein